jgi:hypothetical protein
MNGLTELSEDFGSSFVRLGVTIQFESGTNIRSPDNKSKYSRKKCGKYCFYSLPCLIFVFQ